jgi:hypothetical protein
MSHFQSFGHIRVLGALVVDKRELISYFQNVVPNSYE